MCKDTAAQPPAPVHAFIRDVTEAKLEEIAEDLVVAASPEAYRRRPLQRKAGAGWGGKGWASRRWRMEEWGSWG